MNSFQIVLYSCWDLYHRKFENGVKKDGGFDGCHSGGLWSLLQEILDPLTMSQYRDLNPTSERAPDSKVCLVFTDQLRHKQAAFSHNSLYFAEQLANKQTWCVNVTGEEHFVPVLICFFSRGKVSDDGIICLHYDQLSSDENMTFYAVQNIWNWAPFACNLTYNHNTLVANSNPSNYHKTEIWCRDLIAVSLDDQNYTIWKHSFRCNDSRNGDKTIVADKIYDTNMADKHH